MYYIMVFTIEQCSNAYFSGNKNAWELRKIKNNYMKKNYTKNNKNINILKKIILSNENIYKINSTIVKMVLDELNVEIPLQREKEIVLYIEIVWKDLFPKNLKCNYMEQVNIFNKTLIDFVKPNLFNNILNKINHIKDISRPYGFKFIPLPINTSTYKPNISIKY